MDEDQTVRDHSSRPRFRPADLPHGKAGDESSEGERGQISLIGADVRVAGNIEASDDLVIEGRVEGDVKCTTLIIGEKGQVIGNIDAERLRLSGMVEGTINTHDLAVENGARISGEVYYSRLRVASGGIIEGQMTQRPDQNAHAEQRQQRSQAAPPRDEQPPANGKAKDQSADDIVVFEDRSYRDDQRANGNGAN